MNARAALLLSFLLFLGGTALEAQPLRLSRGLRITRSATIVPQAYRLQGDSGLNSPLILIEGSNLTVDFKGASLSGTSNPTAPDQFTGLAILVKGGRNITLKNLKVRGYRVAIQAVGTDSLRLENCDLSYNYRPRLDATEMQESGAISPAALEWPGQGAGIYLERCTATVISNCTVTGGQHALLMRGCTDGFIYNNEFSFNSGTGIGLSESSRNRLFHNRLNFNVRLAPGSHPPETWAGAGILVQGRSRENLFYRNAATHCGTGLLLLEGQEGSRAENLAMDNDFSFSSSAGIVLRASGNQLVHNRLFDCGVGIDLAGSRETAISGNQFRGNNIGILEQNGLANTIHHNLFLGDDTAIRLKRDGAAPAGNAGSRAAGGFRTVVLGNTFSRNAVALDLTGVSELKITWNTVHGEGLFLRADTTVGSIDTTADAELIYALSEDPLIVEPAGISFRDVREGSGKRSGRHQIRITDWGPYDFRYPALWPRSGQDSAGQVRIDVLGPEGNWELINTQDGSSSSPRNGRFPALIQLEATGRKAVPRRARYRGAPFTDLFGRKVAGAKGVLFGFPATPFVR
jgi:parallel beta-helix repeat protein